jgi:hypothetical protein
MAIRFITASRPHLVAPARTSLIAAFVWLTLLASALAQAPLPAPPVPPLPSAQPPALPYPQSTFPPAPQAAPVYPPMELDRIVSPIALYPDPLLAQTLAAATFAADIPDAAHWADQHHYVTGQALADAIAADQLPWDPSVQALLPFPSVLDMMASAMPWTEELGDAFLSQPADVMDAVQRMRREARDYGYLGSNAQIMVTPGPYVQILPVNPGFIVVPYYDPRVVFVRPRPGVRVAAAISFGYGLRIDAVLGPWGWGSSRFDWGAHTVIIAGAPWGRTWGNRAVYVHPYTVRRYPARRPPEQHRAEPRSRRERDSEWHGRKTEEDHRR